MQADAIAAICASEPPPGAARGDARRAARAPWRARATSPAARVPPPFRYARFARVPGFGRGEATRVQRLLLPLSVVVTAALRAVPFESDVWHKEPSWRP